MAQQAGPVDPLVATRLNAKMWRAITSLGDSRWGRKMDTQGTNEMVVVDIRIPFWSMSLL
jgi:hypothetical protein